MFHLWQQEWVNGDKVEFDGINRLAIVHPEVIDLNIKDDVYKAWVRWLPLQQNTKYLQAMRYSGFDPIPGGFTGDSYFMMNGWKLVVDITRVRIEGVLFSEEDDTAYFDATLRPIYPAKVSSVVSVVSPTISVDGISIPTVEEIRIEMDDNSTKLEQILNSSSATPEQIASAVWNAPTTVITNTTGMGKYILSKILTVAKFIALK